MGGEPEFRISSVKIKASEKWLKEFAETYDVDYTELVREAQRGEDSDLCFSNTSGPEEARTPEFWEHIEERNGEAVF